MAASCWFADRLAGDFAAVDEPAHPGHGVPARPWTWLHQVHRSMVVTVSAPGQYAGASADAAVTATPGCALVVRTADCAPVALLADAGVGIVHAGWKGLLDGVVEQAVGALHELGAGPIRARIGPCISPAHYEFGAAELEQVAAWYGAGVRGRTSDGAPALDLAAAVRAALVAAGVEVLDDQPPACTASDPERYYSFRARADEGRQASFAWLDA